MYLHNWYNKKCCSHFFKAESQVGLFKEIPSGLSSVVGKIVIVVRVQILWSISTATQFIACLPSNKILFECSAGGKLEMECILFGGVFSSQEIFEFSMGKKYQVVCSGDCDRLHSGSCHIPPSSHSFQLFLLQPLHHHVDELSNAYV